MDDTKYLNGLLSAYGIYASLIDESKMEMLYFKKYSTQTYGVKGDSRVVGVNPELSRITICV